MNKTTKLKKPQIPDLDTLYRFDDLGGRPKYGGVEMTHETDIPSFEEIQRHVDTVINVETAARTAADAAEATARTRADEVLSSAIADEASARAAADAAEATARAEADTAEATARAEADADLSEALQTETDNRQAGDSRLQSEIDAIVAGSDVKDIVGTYAELQQYDKSTLGDNDIIKVLDDETQDHAETYYRFHTATQDFEFIGAKAASYTKAESDTLLAGKVDKVQGKGLSEEDYTSAEKTKLAGIEAGAEVNDIASISVNGVAQTPDANKNVDLTISGGVKALTTADYNYPVANPTRIALWLLEPGFYINKTGGLLACAFSNNSSGPLEDGSTLIVSPGYNSIYPNNKSALIMRGGGSRNLINYTGNDGTKAGGSLDPPAGGFSEFSDRIVTSSMVKAATGTSNSVLMSQKAITDAINTATTTLTSAEFEALWEEA